MSFQEKIIDAVRRTLSLNGWNITGIRLTEASKGSGLLNKPVQKCVVEHDNIKTFIIVKRMEQEPRLLFRKLYWEYGHASAKQLEEFDLFCSYLSMRNMPERERAFYQYHERAIDSYVPKFYGMVKLGDTWFLLMEDLFYCEYMDKVSCPEIWGKEEISLAIKTLAFFHNTELCQRERIKNCEENIKYDGIACFLESLEQNMITYAGIERIADVDRAAFDFISHLCEYEKRMDDYGRRMIHQDFNIRNICIDKANWQLKVYDWEFLDYKNPIFDLVDLLLSLSQKALLHESIDYWIKVYLTESMKYGAKRQMLGDVKEQLYYNSLKYAATRMNMYLLFYARKKDSYMERMYKNLFLLLSYCKKGGI